MNIAYLGHSLVATRQALFEAALRRELEQRGHTLVSMFPESWAQHERDTDKPHATAWSVKHAGNIYRYEYPQDAWQWLHDQNPDALLIQQEAYCVASVQAANYSKSTDTPLVTFNWENQKPPRDTGAYQVLQHATINLFGNLDAARLAHDDNCRGDAWFITPQVGIDADLFSPNDDVKEHDVGFFGRASDPMKGYSYLGEACEEMDLDLLNFSDEPFAPYEELPTWYNRCGVVAVPSIDPDPEQGERFAREQYAPAVHVEASLCGVPVVTTTQNAIWTWTSTNPGAVHVPERDADALATQLHWTLKRRTTLGLQARDWAQENLSNTAVATRYANILETLE